MLSSRYRACWRSQQAFQPICTGFYDPSEPGQIVRRVILCAENPGRCISQIFKQGDDHSRCLVRVGGRQDAFFDALTDHLLQPGSETFHAGFVEFVAKMAFSSPYQTRRGSSTRPLCACFQWSSVVKKCWSLVSMPVVGSWTMGRHQLLYLVPYALD